MQIQARDAEGIGISEVINASLTDAQKEIWILAQRDENACRAYNIPLVLRLRGVLDVEALRQAIQDVVNRHEALRTTVSLDGQAQQIRKTLAMNVPLLDFSAFSLEESSETLNNFLASESNWLFDLTHGPLFRASVVRLEQAHHLLIVVVHHIISDGWSMSVLAKDIADAYAARLQGSFLTKQPPLQPREYANWLNQELQHPSMQDHESYWLGHLTGLLPQLELPTDRPRPPAVTFSGAREA